MNMGILAEIQDHGPSLAANQRLHLHAVLVLQHQTPTETESDTQPYHGALV